MTKIMDVSEAAALVKDGMSVMVGGFLGCGSPDLLIDEIVKNRVVNLTIIANDTGFPGASLGKLQDNHSIKKLYVSYIGGHPETGRQMQNGEIEVVLVPQGNLAEKIRAEGFGLGGILTPTGVGTIVQEGKELIEVEGKKYILERPLKADVALIKAHKADEKGNLIYRKSAKNFNPLMATAADLVIAEVDEIVAIGSIDPELVHTPGLFVDIIAKGGK
ncbi:MAG: CoA transferase subunit A [Bacillota bacterium]